MSAMWTNGCCGSYGNANGKILREVTADSFLRWRAEQKQAPKTINEYQAALSALFHTRLRKQNRVAANPFEIVSKVDTRGKQRIQRRALNDDDQLVYIAGGTAQAALSAGHAQRQSQRKIAMRCAGLVVRPMK